MNVVLSRPEHRLSLVREEHYREAPDRKVRGFDNFYKLKFESAFSVCGSGRVIPEFI